MPPLHIMGDVSHGRRRVSALRVGVGTGPYRDMMALGPHPAAIANAGTPIICRGRIYPARHRPVGKPALMVWDTLV